MRSYRALRGGSHCGDDFCLRTTFSYWTGSEDRIWRIGFRIVVVRGKP